MREFKFKLTEEEANTVINALMELPAKIVNPLLQKLHQQAKHQIEQGDTDAGSDTSTT